MRTKLSTDLRAMHAYIARHGFSTGYGVHGGPRCFFGAGNSALLLDGDDTRRRDRAETFLGNIIGDQMIFASSRLIAGGWRKRDALAALEIAADCAEARGR